MKKTILFFAAFAALASCTKENLPDNSQSAESFAITLEATAPSTSGDYTKTTLVDHSLVHWTKGDAIKVGFPGTIGMRSQILNKVGEFTSTFEEESSSSARFSLDNWNWHYKNTIDGAEYDANAYAGTGLAMYPTTVGFSSTRESANVNVETTIQYTLTSSQTAVENSFKSDLCFSTAKLSKSEFIDNTAELTFKNECALIKIVLPADVNDVVSINISSISGNALTGKFYYYYSNFYNDPSFPVEFTITDAVTSVDLNAPENETLKGGSSYYMVVCPGTHSSGLAFTFTNTDGKTCRKVVSSEVVLEKSKIDQFKFKSIVYAAEINYNDAKVGDYFYSDGSFSTELDQTKELVGVVFYRGTQHMTDDKTLAASDYKHCNHGLVVATTSSGSGSLSSNTGSWYSFSDWGVSNGFMSSKGYTYSGPTKLDNAKLMTGYNNTQALIGFVNATNGFRSSAVNAINTKNTNDVVKGVSCWYYPSIAEFDILMTSKAELRNAIDLVNDKLQVVGGKITGEYWTVSEENTSGCFAAIYDTTNLVKIKDGDGDSTTSAYLPIFAF